ncbi:MAG: ATP-dependent 6-phosphofructokinase [Clostridiales bacterium]|jgi:6-phosphofructokinase 1|nr:ATP-dependent 6-phosphofructokinase [Clostridiales bacterium]
MSKKMKIGLLTGGGDAPGLNAVIYAFTRAALSAFPGCDIIGYRFGYRGLYYNEYMKLDLESTSGILHKGGTILFSSNKDNLFDYTVVENGVKVKRDVSDTAVRNMREEGVDVLVVLGGDGTLTSARDFSNKGVPVIGIPKTIDNDLGATDTTFGFDTAVSIVTENLGRVHTTAESHHRVIIVEIMGRSAGWITLSAGIAGSADVILIPEIPYKVENIVRKIKARDAAGKHFAIIAIGEGAREAGGSAVVGKIVEDSPDPIRFGGVAAKLAHDIEPLVDHEVRAVQLGHIQRGGDASPADRILSVRYGVHAVEMIKRGEFGKMACLRNGRMSEVSLNDVIANNKYVGPDDELVKCAKALGMSFADED